MAKQTTKKEFIKDFLKITERVLKTELGFDYGAESEFIEAAYDILYKKIVHIRTRMERG